MTTLLTNRSQLKENLVSLTELGGLLELTPEELNQPLLLLETPLKLKPIRIDEKLYLEPLQADLLLSLQPLLKDLDALQDLLLALKDGALIYRCSTCGKLHLTEKILTGAALEHSCNELAPGNRKRQSAGRYQLIASGSLENVALWLQSLHLGLDSQTRGI